MMITLPDKQCSKPEIAEKIERAFEQFERGDFLTSEESRANMQERKAAWLREAGLKPIPGTA